MGLKRFQLLLVLCLSSLVFLGMVHFGIKHSVHSLLVEEADRTGMDWAHHIAERIPDLPNMKKTDGTLDAFQVPDRDQFSSLVSDVLAVGNIYQVDFINSNCFCELTMGSHDGEHSHNHSAGTHEVAENSAFAEMEHHTTANEAHHQHNHDKPSSKNNLKTPSTGALEHIFSGEESHEPMSKPGDTATQLPIDRSLVLSIVKSQIHQIVIRADSVANQPKTFAEVYHPVTANGETAYVLRLLVNLEDEAIRYEAVMYSGAGFILLLLAISFTYPARKYLLTSKKHREADQRARYLASHDVLTGIANRNGFLETIPGRLEACLSENGSSVLFLVNINNFKAINDLHGHQTGDQVLLEVARKLAECAPCDGFVARVGGDEFAVVVCGKEFSSTPGEKILDFPRSIDLRIEESGQIVSASTTVGLARFPRDGNDLKALMHSADLALFDAKTSKTNTIREYTPGMGDALKERLRLFSSFRLALQSSQIIPYYQPLVSIETGRVVGFEALARWDHPEKGILTPEVFHEALEDRELGALVGSEMLRQVLKDMGTWKATGVAFECVGLNVGEGDLLRPGFVLDIASGLAKHNLLGKNLAVEVLENCVFGKNKDAHLEKLEELHSLGCEVALDDFGTGYSSITQIKVLPCTAVKVDKSFVREIVEADVDQAIVTALVQLGESIGFKLVAEGVETASQLNLLRSLGVHLAQGYFYAKPVAACDVPDVIERLNDGIDCENRDKFACASLARAGPQLRSNAESQLPDVI